MQTASLNGLFFLVLPKTDWKESEEKLFSICVTCLYVVSSMLRIEVKVSWGPTEGCESQKANRCCTGDGSQATLLAGNLSH